MLIQQSEIISSKNCNHWRSSVHRYFVYSNQGKCNLSPSIRKILGALMGLLGSFIFSMFLIISQSQF